MSDYFHHGASMNINPLNILKVVFSALAIGSFPALATEADPPVITVNKLFNEILAFPEPIDGWQVDSYSTFAISIWTREQDGLRQRRLSENKDNFVLTHSLTSGPVLLNDANAWFFEGASNDFARDGTWMGLKYAFLPESVLLEKDADRDAPLYFYLFKKVPNKLQWSNRSRGC
jgi:hypothetical protein